MAALIPVDLLNEQLVGLGVIADTLHAEKDGESFLPEVKLPLYLPLGLRILRHKMTHAKAPQCPLKLR